MFAGFCVFNIGCIFINPSGSLKKLFLCNRHKTYYDLLMMPGNKKFRTRELSSQINSARLPSMCMYLQSEDENEECYREISPCGGTRMLAGEYFYRPSNEEILQEFSDKFDLHMNLVTIEDFGGWNAAYEIYFNDGAVFDQIYSE